MLRVLWVVLALIVATQAQAREICWSAGSCPSEGFWAKPAPRYHARTAIAQRVVAGELANAEGETAYAAKGVYHSEGTRFAVYPNIKKKGDTRYVLSLSETGIWSFVRARDVPRPVSNTERSAIRSAMDEVEAIDTVVYLARDDRYFKVTNNACVGKSGLTNAGSLTVGGKTPLGPIATEISASLSMSLALEPDKGWTVVTDRFRSALTDEMVEILSYSACGVNVGQRHDYVFDVFLNFEGRNLRGELVSETGLPMVRGKPIIGCLQHYEIYAQYLQDEHNISPHWVPIVAAMTARWQKYQSYTVCEKNLTV